MSKNTHCMPSNAKTVLLFVCLAIQTFASFAQQVSKKGADIRFKKHVLSTEYISEGVNISDINKDGRTDVLAGTFWFDGKDWTRHELTVPEINPSIGGYGNSFLNFSMDVNQDSWPDHIKVGFPGKEAYWYENPQNKPGHWREHLVFHAVGNESPLFDDIDGDGRKDLICSDPVNKRVVWLKAPVAETAAGWTPYTISADSLLGTHHFTHGLGLGDVNLDGYPDVLIREGWWEGSEDPEKPDWTFHRADWGEECAQMYTLDVDGDGDQDVISSSAHAYGIWWYEQLKDDKGAIAWKRHVITEEFSQTHGLSMTDINNDGYPDLVTGKRFWAHNGGDPGANEPAVLYWFEFQPGENPVWKAHLIDDDSGIGLHLVTEDINGDGLTDIVIANKKGVFVFEQL